MKDIKWAVLGTGVIANEMAQALIKKGKSIYSVANRTHQKAVEFAKKYNINKVYEDMKDVFEDPEVDVVYITTPHNTHYEFMIKAINNGKHILVEKSITLNTSELSRVINLAEQKGVVVAEAMTIYHMPIYKKLKEMLKSGVLGKVNLITMNFGSFKEYDMNNRFFNPNLAGGAMLDIGVYALSFIRWFMDSKPDKCASQTKSAPTGVDEQVGLLLMNDEGQMASVMLSLHSKQPKRGMISCEKGYIEIMEYPRAWEATIHYVESGETQKITAGENADALVYELEDMERAINGEHGCMHLDYTWDVMDMMTGVRNFKYPEEMCSQKDYDMEYINFDKDEPSLFCFLFMCANAFEEIKRYSQNIELYEKSGFVRFKKTKTENKGFVYLEKIENRTENIKDEHYSVSWGF